MCGSLAKNLRLPIALHNSTLCHKIEVLCVFSSVFPVLILGSTCLKNELFAIHLLTWIVASALIIGDRVAN